MASNNISLILEPLDGHEFISTLRSFRKLLSSCVGPGGGIKILISAADYSTYTSSSLRLLNSITLQDPVCLYINQVIKSQINIYHNHGLYIGIFITSLLENILSHSESLSSSTVIKILEYLASKLTHLLQLDCVKFKIDFSTVKQLLPLVQSILSSKPLCGLTKTEVQDLQICIVKAFIQSVGKTLGNILVECYEGSMEKNHIFQGILYHVSYDDLTLFNEKTKKDEIKVLLFNIMLTHEYDDLKVSDKRCVIIEKNKKKNSVIEEAIELFEEALRLDIDIVACQKVVHPDLCLYLQRKGIMVLERLGTDLTAALEKLSQATPISSTSGCPRDRLNTFIGRIDSVKIVEYGQKYYLSLEKYDGTVATLLTHAPNEEAATELKIVINQCLCALSTLLIHPEVVPGAGCFEMSLAVHLLKEVMADNLTCTRSQLQSCVSWLQTALLSAAGFSHSGSSILTVDSVFGHMWKSNKEECSCKLVSESMVRDKNGKWLEVFNNFELILYQNMKLFSSLSLNSFSMKEYAVVDLYKSKQNAIQLALDTCINLLGIGMIVYKIPNDD